MTGKVSPKVRLVRCPRCRQVLPELAEVPVYKCGGCGAVLEAKKPKNGTVDENSSGDRKTVQVSGDQESGRSSNQHSQENSVIEPDRNSDHNEARTSTELSNHEDPESSPEVITHIQTDQDHDQEQEYDQDQEHNQDEDQEHEQDRFMNQVSENCKKGAEFEENSGELSISPEKFSSSELNEAIANMEIVKDSHGGSNSNFKSLIAEKLLDTRQRKVSNNHDEDDTFSEDSSADLYHRKRFNQISSVETLENPRFGNTNYYYEGSVSSFDGNENRVAGNSFFPANVRRGKDPVTRSDKVNHRSTGVRSFYANPRHRPPVVHENPNLEKLELLKMVRELQDQLERTNVPLYYNHILARPAGFDRRMAFSGETTAVGRTHSPCHHCCPPDRHFSAQLPRNLVCCHGPHYGPGPYYGPSSPQHHSGHSPYYGPSSPQHHSRPGQYYGPSSPQPHSRPIQYFGPSSPQHHSGPDFSVLVRPEPKPDNLRHQKRRHLRPVSGGSPVITCYRCSELLQLPQSFLVFKKRYHRLRCGSCLKVLNFTVSNGTRVSRYYPEETIAAPPCSEVEDYSESTGSRPDPVSCSDRSFQKSYSTETDKRGSSELIEDRKKSNRSGRAVRPGRKKMTSEIEEVEVATGGSPLHRLMGYASPSKVIRG